jgi:hypothetical protein
VYYAWRFVIAVEESGLQAFNNDSICQAFLEIILASPDHADADIVQSVAKVIRMMLPHLHVLPMSSIMIEKMWNILIGGLLLKLDRGYSGRLEIIRTIIAFLENGVSASLPDRQSLPELLAEFSNEEEKKALARSVGIEL